MLYILLALAALYCFAVVVYRLYFHPLRSIPGPRLAAATGWWEFYYDIVLNGRLLFDYEKLHEKYGPVVRISPRAVHVMDLELYHEIFKHNTAYVKDAHFYHAVSQPNGLIAIIDPAEYRARRELVSPFFSKRAVYALDDLLREKLDRFCQRIAETVGEPVLLQDGFHCLTVDIISAYLFGKSFDMLYEPNFNGIHIRNMEKLVSGIPMCKHFPFLRKVALALPKSIASHVAPGFTHIAEIAENAVREVLDSKTTTNREKDKPTESDLISGSDSGLKHRTIYDALLDQSSLAAKGRRPLNLAELIDESILFLGAGTDTVSFALTMAIYHVLRNPDVKTKLFQELSEVKERFGDHRLLLRDIENLPYLTGVVKESIRFSEGVPGKLPRIAPPTGTRVGNAYLPPGTVISMSSYYINHHPQIYPEPFRFWPDRWTLNPPPDKWFVPFSKGSRACVAINLAYAEIYLTIATLFMKFDLQLYQTGNEEMEWRDCGLCLTKGHLKVIATPR